MVSVPSGAVCVDRRHAHVAGKAEGGLAAVVADLRRLDRGRALRDIAPVARALGPGFGESCRRRFLGCRGGLACLSRGTLGALVVGVDEIDREEGGIVATRSRAERRPDETGRSGSSHPGRRVTTCMLVDGRTSVGLRNSRLPAGCASHASASPIATWVISSRAAKMICVELVGLPTTRTTLSGL